MKRKDKNTIKVTRELMNSLLDNPNEVDKQFGHDFSAIDIAWELLGEGDQRAAAFLYRSARKAAICDYIIKLREKNSLEYVSVGLSSENPKLRKNTAKLIGVLRNPEDAQSLIYALNNESTRMVIPSIILALGSLKSKEAYEALKQYSIKPVKDSTEEKHKKEEEEALRKALGAYQSTEKHTFIGFKNYSVHLICATSMGQYVAGDCTQLGINVRSYSDSSVVVSEVELEDLMKVRSYREILIPLCSHRSDNKNLYNRLLQILQATHDSDGRPFRYRIEYRGTGDRKAHIMSIAELLRGDMLINSVSDYEVELRVYENGSIKVKLFTFDDNRFNYRKKALPASISPANAASIMSFAQPYLTENAVVLDMCCGSGTMLFERNEFKPCKRIMGVDISEKAILAAKENARIAAPNALFYQTDCTRFTLRTPVDEIISNLPFGNRVGTHKDNERLYTSIFDCMERWLRPDGIAILYTMEYKLIMEQIKNRNAFQLLDNIKTEAGGLMPAIVILKKIN